MSETTYGITFLPPSEAAVNDLEAGLAKGTLWGKPAPPGAVISAMWATLFCQWASCSSIWQLTTMSKGFSGWYS